MCGLNSDLMYGIYIYAVLYFYSLGSLYTYERIIAIVKFYYGIVYLKFVSTGSL